MKTNTLKSETNPALAPGTRVVVRDVEWLVRRVDRTSTGGQALSVVGISELVRDREAVFRANHSPYFHRLIEMFRLQLKNVIE